MTPEQAALRSRKLSAYFLWATGAILVVSWFLFVSALLASSLQLAGLGALMLIPAAGCALASIAFYEIKP